MVGVHVRNLAPPGSPLRPAGSSAGDGNRFHELHGDATADVVVVGAGIAGLTAAALLKEQGRRVAVIDAGPAAAGVAGYTSVDDLDPGDAAVLVVGRERVGVFRDGGGQVHALSAVCTHMGCTVSWNTAGTTWDCPCHGSPFTCDGAVIQGPAVKDLEPRQVQA